MMMSLRRLNEVCPMLCVGPGSRDADIGKLAAELRRELRRLSDGGPAFGTGRFCAPDLPALFPPERRLAVLTGRAEYRDWRYAAAVRLARLIVGARREKPLAVWDERAEELERHPLISEGAGPFAFVRAALAGAGADGMEELLGVAPVWRGMTIGNFIAAGSTSQVYRVERHGAERVLKLPCAGAEARFRGEVELLRRCEHPHLPRLDEWSLDTPPYCVMKFCRTGRSVKSADCGAALLSALDYLHAAGMVHGDIRWSNLGRDLSGVPVLLDLSHARNSGSPGESAAETEKMKRLLA